MQIKYETNRLIIKKIEMSDANELMTMFNDRELEMQSGLALPTNEAERTMAFQMMSVRDYIYVIRLRQTNHLIGVVGLYPCYLPDLSTAENDRELGYALKRDQWNQGIMTETCQVLVGDFLEENSNHILHANVLPRNHRSLRVLQKVGFVETKTPDYLVIDDTQGDKIHLQCGPLK
ncbi:GNAT family N-acetyltransferase [Paucilactobacillus suebicus]|uniref:N-acetyltransferase domain-containing protein n=1 Tax=Paucilactobacillus suebicus DSM 5007 = KCTC 3549 TaxID=1423807 RepID=A0A0R1W7C2_9LACO|nr:GNAT family N-acetyltransferase [Paucilactobacillus suebicus]KRM13391.1 hypothetical protein FD16_GL000866 [Paucilactobacillus suebicus DSM 5007 = KCTC 3549]